MNKWTAPKDDDMKNAVMMLNEMFPPPSALQYRVTSMTGTPNNPTFSMICMLLDQTFEETGRSKKEAKLAASQKISKISENSSHLWYTFDPLAFIIHKLQETLEGCTTKNRQYSYNLKELMTANMLTKICGTFPTSSCSTRGWLWENKLEHCVLN